MLDHVQTVIPFSNIRGLMQDFTLQLDRMIGEQRRGTKYEKVRKSDIRVFISISRRKQTVTEIAREMDVTRQAIHSSVKRLIDMDVVGLVPQPGNHKEKLVVITERGEKTRAYAMEQIASLEAECASIIGQQGLETFRALLLALVLGLKAKEEGRSFHATGV